MPIAFSVAGSPSTKGSGRAYTYRRKDGGIGARVDNDAGEKAKSWAAVVGWAAREAMQGSAPLSGPVHVETVFYLPRPKSHYRKNGQLKPGAPTHAAGRPDGDKATRLTWDAMTGIVYVDDSRIVKWSGEKLYSNDGRTGARIVVTALDEALRALGVAVQPGLGLGAA